MKRIFYTLALIAVAATACQKEDFKPEKEKTTIDVISEYIESKFDSRVALRNITDRTYRVESESISRIDSRYSYVTDGNYIVEYERRNKIPEGYTRRYYETCLPYGVSEMAVFDYDSTSGDWISPKYLYTVQYEGFMGGMTGLRVETSKPQQDIVYYVERTPNSRPGVRFKDSSPIPLTKSQMDGILEYSNNMSYGVDCTFVHQTVISRIGGVVDSVDNGWFLQPGFVRDLLRDYYNGLRDPMWRNANKDMVGCAKIVTHLLCIGNGSGYTYSITAECGSVNSDRVYRIPIQYGVSPTQLIPDSLYVGGVAIKKIQ